MKKIAFILSLFIFCLFLDTILFAQTTESFSYDGITELTVKGRYAKVIIDGQNGNQLTFKGEITGSGNDEIKYEKNGNSLKVWLEVNGNSWGNKKATLDFKVPKGIELVVDNSSGGVSASNLDGPKIELLASSGSIYAENISSGLILKTSSGGIKAKEITGDINAKSSSGGQHLDNIVGNIKAVATSGGVKVSNVKGSLNISNSSGGISGDEVMLTQSSSFKTSSGGIKMDFVNDLDDLSFECSASSGNIKIGEESSGKKIILKYGDIMIHGVSSSGSQKYSTK
ncbi:hypothetical protein R9C00_27175 [Flammeovirgaceae bacterium SG7u.111]|nr:hypothetical protein [Flammeovirgaceae bacterium SG7u.132]WPO35384.1 hypothetical protein R9C00_27175 [Flammeovirgaceae bacterium SG7u.111]